MLKRTISRTLAGSAAYLASSATFAQDNAPGWLVDALYSSGKMYTVITVISVVLIGLVTWLFLMDRRIKRMEENSGK